jgi:hypothetical protein
MAKSDRDHAQQLWEMATKDHQALANRRDANKFAEEIFGFHAQQVIEKGLKAWQRDSVVSETEAFLNHVKQIIGSIVKPTNPLI